MTPSPLAACDPEVVTRLEADIAEVCGVINAAHGRLVDLISSVIATEAWKMAGIGSVEHWVTWKCGLAAHRARVLVAMANRMSELPEVRSAFRAGELSVDQVAVVARHVPAHVDAEVAAFAKEATVDQLQRSLPRYSFARPTEADGGPGEAASVVAKATTEPEIERRVSFGYQDDGSWRLLARLGPDEGALIEAALVSARDELFRSDETGEAGKTRVTWADALMAVADRSLAEGARIRPARDRHLMLVHLRTDQFNRTGGSGHQGLSAQIHLGPALPDSVRRQLGCDGRIRPVFEKLGVALSVGRTQRIVPDRTRTAIEDRDGGCRVPGCLRRRWLQIHHIVHWEDGGRTDTSNLIAICSHHHRLHHRRALGISGDADQPDGLRYTDQEGRPISAAGKPLLPGSIEAGVASLDLRATEWIHPSGERLNTRYVHFNELGFANDMQADRRAG